MDDETQQQQQQVKKQVERVRCYESAFSTQDGEKVLDEMMANFHIFRTTASDDPLAMAFMEGQRSVVLEIMDKMGYSKKAAVIMRALERGMEDLVK